MPSALPHPFYRCTALFCAVLVGVLCLLAASPELHEKLHSDAGHEDHECAVTLFLHGFEGATIAIGLLVIALRLLCSVVDVPAPIRHPAPRYWLLPGRAPPRA